MYKILYNLSNNENILKAANKLSKEISSNFVVGNLGTEASVEDVIHRIDKFDGIRAGVGSGSICITAEVTKAGSPTLFAVSQIASKLQEHNLSKPIIADGGIQSSGDAALAFAIGASSVMMGNVFAGCNESPGNLIKIGGKYYKQYLKYITEINDFFYDIPTHISSCFFSKKGNYF